MAAITRLGGVLLIALWYLSNRVVHWVQDGYLSAAGFAAPDEESLNYPSYSAIGQIPIALVLAGILIAVTNSFTISRRRGLWTGAVSVLILASTAVTVAVVTHQAGPLARTCASGWQRTVVETSVSWSIRCVDQNFQLQGNPGRAQDHQRYQLGHENVYIVATFHA